MCGLFSYSLIPPFIYLFISIYLYYVLNLFVLFCLLCFACVCVCACVRVCVCVKSCGVLSVFWFVVGILFVLLMCFGGLLFGLVGFLCWFLFLNFVGFFFFLVFVRVWVFCGGFSFDIPKVRSKTIHKLPFDAEGVDICAVCVSQ